MSSLSKSRKILFFLLAALTFNFIEAQTPNAREIVKRSYDLMQGESNESYISVEIVRPTWKRTITVHSWAKGKDYSMAVITDPPKEKGQAFLKRKNEIWNWQPSIQRMIKLPPSMMSEGWMGSDFSNDDLLKETSIVDDYEHNLIGSEKVNGFDCYKIKLTPKSEAAVVWGSIVKWISKDNYYQLKSEYYDEENVLIKTEYASEIKEMGGRIIPTQFELIPADKPGHKTIVRLLKVKFNIALSENFFSQQQMKNIK
ncbi:MAG: outer membrane lipoprotein-sorting protein [Bacteroidales bacterium]|nr:outer membrane lipoprotein-sorting protein [Bacteroidales bacterium]